MTNVYKLEVMIIDHDGIGEACVKAAIEDARYPNRCIAPSVQSIEVRDIGEWSDDHPLNLRSTADAEFDRLFHADLAQPSHVPDGWKLMPIDPAWEIIEAAFAGRVEVQCVTTQMKARAYMKWGAEQEPFARIAYEAQTGELVQESGFTYLPDLAAGCSVDGFIDGDRLGIVEYKCPISTTHIEYLLGGKLPPKYEPQVTHNMFVTGAQFCDFASFDPRMPEHLQLFIFRVERDDEKMASYEIALRAFLAEVDSLYDRLNKWAD